MQNLRSFVQAFAYRIQAVVVRYVIQKLDGRLFRYFCQISVGNSRCLDRLFSAKWILERSDPF